MDVNTTVFTIPLGSGAQQFTVSLGEKSVMMRLIWRTATGGGWFMDVFESDGITPIVCGLPIRCGHNLFEQYQYLGLGKMLALIDGQADRDPSYDDMGSNLQLYWTPWPDNTNATAN